ncbi:MAG: four helix bundle protein [Burkholderiaceae bacterium]|nr:four helix bundle protein [Burkholderiaceae bacterium]
MRDTDKRRPAIEHRQTNSIPIPEQSRNERTTPIPEQPRAWKPGQFDHERLDAYWVAREALARGDRLAQQLPRGYAKLADQLRRALLSAYLGVAEAACRTGNDRLARFRCARGEAAEAAAALDAVAMLRLAKSSDVDIIISLLRRLAAMLTRLAKLSR